MNQSMRDMLQQYIDDTAEHHRLYHTGKFDTCEMTGCCLARDIRDGGVSSDTYAAIIKGNEKVYHETD